MTKETIEIVRPDPFGHEERAKVEKSGRYFGYEEYGNGDEFTAVALADGSVDFAINEPWAGDTFSGFGARCSITLPREAIPHLIAALNEALAAPDSEDPS